MKLVRLKPHNGKNHKLQSYTCFGIKFVGTKGWYKVDDDVAEYVSQVKQVQEGTDAEYSAHAFDVVGTIEEAKAIEEREKKKVARATAENAHKATRVHAVSPRGGVAIPSKTMTTKDLPSNFDDLDGTFPDGDMAPPRAKPAATIDGADDGEGEVDDGGESFDLHNEHPSEPPPAAGAGLLPQPQRPHHSSKKGGAKARP
jgi:hypothetical protein